MDKVKKISDIICYVDRNIETDKFLIHCSARYIIDGDPGNSGIIYNVYEVPDKLSLEDAAKYSKELFKHGLIMEGYEVDE